MKLPVILQTRIGSTRLPGKALLPLCGKPMLAFVLEALLSAERVSTVVVAVPENSAAAIRPIAGEYGCPLVTGSEEDVLDRFLGALAAFPAPHFVRATGDNPLVSPELIDSIIDIHISREADLSHYLGIPTGCGVEVVRSAALECAGWEAREPAMREHVTPFLYADRARFHIEEPDLGLDPGLRLTVDTAADFARVERILTAAGQGKPLPLARILALYSECPGLFT
jgi:spore coat polysaccharide biosynthesis protein SpsF